MSQYLVFRGVLLAENIAFILMKVACTEMSASKPCRRNRVMQDTSNGDLSIINVKLFFN